MIGAEKVGTPDFGKMSANDSTVELFPAAVVHRAIPTFLAHKFLFSACQHLVIGCVAFPRK
jgi:hypothetical protein